MTNTAKTSGSSSNFVDELFSYKCYLCDKDAFKTEKYD